MDTFDRATAKRLMAARLHITVSTDRLASLMAQSPKAFATRRPSRSIDPKRLAVLTDETGHPRMKRLSR
jgi:hypothetical protein